MNIRDIVAQEQTAAGKDAGRTSATVYAGQMAGEGMVAKLAQNMVVGGNMEVPVTPSASKDGETSENYSFSEVMAAAAEGVETNEKAEQNLAILTGEDYSRLEDQEGALEKYQESTLERAVERIRSEREWKQERLEENEALRAELQEGLERVQATGFLSEKSEAQIREALQRANLPVTQELIYQIVSALQMSQSAVGMSDSAKHFLMAQQLPATIENIYHAEYSGMEGMTGEEIPAEVWEKYGPQIEKILAELGDAGEDQMNRAKWLFANELPVNSGTLEWIQQLESLADGVGLDHTLNQIIETLAAGRQAVDTDLIQSDRMHQEYQEAAEFISRVGELGELDIRRALAEMQNQASDQEGGDPSQEKNPDLTLQQLLESGEKQNTTSMVVDPDLDIQTITARRQLEEIRLMMTVQSVVQLHRQGFDIATEPLENVVKQLQEIENAYYMAQAQDRGIVPEVRELEQMREAVHQVADIAQSPAAVLGISLRQHQLLTVEELHGIAVRTTNQYEQYERNFEAVGTQVRHDLGDSIHKAFAGIPQMLQDMGLEVTMANERAVRILGYNSMEVTPEAIQEMKQWDAEVQRLIKLMRPSTVLEMIREGQNPLNTPIAELNEQLSEKNQERQPSEEERYSRYLWQLEKQGAIEEEERREYIGVYRLLHQIEKSDGAVIGAVLQAGQQMDLGHLRTAVRTMRAHGVDETISEKDGVRDTPAQYYQNLAEEMLQTVTPAKIREVSGGNPEQLMDRPLEKVAEELQQASGDPAALQEYYQEQAEDLRETVRQADQARVYLKQFELPDTLENIRAAEFLLEEGGSPVKELIDRRKVLEQEEQQEMEELLEDLPEAIDAPEVLQEKCIQAEKYMQEILTKSQETADITSEDLKHLKLLGQSLRLQQALTRKQSYEIPIRTGDTVTTMNLTILHGGDETGKVRISMEEETFGRVSGEVQLQGEQIKGLILCDDRVGFDALKEQGTTLTERLETAGYSVKNISYGMDYKARSEMTGSVSTEEQADTAKLYQIAKILVRHVSDTAKQNRSQ